MPLVFSSLTLLIRKIEILLRAYLFSRPRMRPPSKEDVEKSFLYSWRYSGSCKSGDRNAELAMRRLGLIIKQSVQAIGVTTSTDDDGGTTGSDGGITGGDGGITGGVGGITGGGEGSVMLPLVMGILTVITLPILGKAPTLNEALIVVGALVNTPFGTN